MEPSHYTILILDDDQAQIELIRDYLQLKLDCAVYSASSGKEFWDLFEQRDYSIIFMDYRLPDTDGINTLQELARRGSRVPVIIVTGEGNEMVAARSIQEGAFDYLVKGRYSLHRLLALIEKATATRKLEESVADSIAKIRYQATLLDNVRDAVVVWDQEGRITFWNPAAYLLFGMKPDEVIGKSINLVYLNAFNPPIQIPSLYDTGGLEIERQYTNSKGQTRWISSRVSVLRDLSNPAQLLGYIDVSRDITRRKREQQALRESEARYRAIVEDHQTEHIFRSLANTRLTFVNEVFCKYFQTSRDELIGVPFIDFVYEEDRESLLGQFGKLSRQNMVVTCEFRVCLPTGEIRWNEATLRAIFDDLGNYIEIQSVGHDITQRKEMEAQIQRSQTHLLQSARMASIGQLAAGVAHQIYNPLTTVIAESQLLMKMIEPSHPAQESLTAIVAAGWRSQKVVQQLLEYSQPAQSSLSPVSINQTIQQALQLVGLNAGDPCIELELSLADPLPSVYCDPHQIEDLWVNLLLLARAAIRDGDCHTIGVRTTADESGNVVVEIRDDGEPVPVSQLDTIFEPTLEPVGGRGNGMELSICSEIVRQNRGKITIQSDTNGTRMQVILPQKGEIVR